jgi:hypothetical protein
MTYLLARFLSPAFYPILLSWWGWITGGIIYADIMYARRVLHNRDY